MNQPPRRTEPCEPVSTIESLDQNQRLGVSLEPYLNFAPIAFHAAALRERSPPQHPPLSHTHHTSATVISGPMPVPADRRAAVRAERRRVARPMWHGATTVGATRGMGAGRMEPNSLQMETWFLHLMLSDCFCFVEGR